MNGFKRSNASRKGSSQSEDILESETSLNDTHTLTNVIKRAAPFPPQTCNGDNTSVESWISTETLVERL